MNSMKRAFRYGWGPAILLTVMILNSCGGKAVTYSSNTRPGFQILKSYQWGKAMGLHRQDPILEANIQFLVDRSLETRGFVKGTERAELVLWASYEFDYNDLTNKLRSLSLNMARTDNSELIWQGTAIGEIKSDPSGGELKTILENILANFPAK